MHFERRSKRGFWNFIENWRSEKFRKFVKESKDKIQAPEKITILNFNFDFIVKTKTKTPFVMSNRWIEKDVSTAREGDRQKKLAEADIQVKSLRIWPRPCFFQATQNFGAKRVQIFLSDETGLVRQNTISKIDAVAFVKVKEIIVSKENCGCAIPKN